MRTALNIVGVILVLFRRDLVPPRHQRVAGQLYDRRHSMGGVRWNRGRCGSALAAGGQPAWKLHRQALSHSGG
jgi:hypothetical protein